MNSKEKQELIEEFGPMDDFSDDVPTIEGSDDRNGRKDQDLTPPDGIPIPVATDGVPDSGNDRTASLESELAETKDRLLRLAADFENFKKRRLREKEEQQKYSNERLLKDLLPVMDNLERALQSALASGQAPAITAGLELVVHDFARLLSREGIEPVISVGRPFDPSFQEALQQIETTEFAPGTVAGEILKGYTIYGRVLRAALVAVAREPQQRN